MTGESYEQMLRDADPYRSGSGVSPDEELLTQILAEPRARKSPSRLAVVGVAAGVLAVVAGIAIPLASTGSPEPPSASSPPSASGAPSLPGPDPLLESPKARKAAEEGPRLVMGEPGWKIIHLEPFGDHEGEMAWKKGNRVLNSSWFVEAEYAQRRSDKQKGAEKVAVGGLTGWMIANGGKQMRVTTEPRDSDGVFATVDSGPGWTRAEFRAFLAAMREVDVEAWIAAAEPDLQQSNAAGKRAYQIFARGALPRPPSLESAVIDRLGAGDPAEFETTLTKQVTCNWLTRWARAGVTGDTAAREAAGAALRDSENWPLLRELESQGSDLRRTIVAIAADVVDGGAGRGEINDYRHSLC